MGPELPLVKAYSGPTTTAMSTQCLTHQEVSSLCLGATWTLPSPVWVSELFGLLPYCGSFSSFWYFVHTHTHTHPQIGSSLRCEEIPLQISRPLSLSLSLSFMLCLENSSHLDLLQLQNLSCQLSWTARLYPDTRPGTAARKLPLGWNSSGHSLLLSFCQQLLPCVVCCLMSENTCITYVVHCSCYLRQEGNSELCYSITFWSTDPTCALHLSILPESGTYPPD